MTRSASLESTFDLDDAQLKITSYLRLFLGGKARHALADDLPAEMPTVLIDFINADGKQMRTGLSLPGTAGVGVPGARCHGRVPALVRSSNWPARQVLTWRQWPQVGGHVCVRWPDYGRW
ncbi:hypothetical protein ABTZ78_12135 [Streptomyces bauhiniae]|uniref:hypothetical protein n=1 Tax=Streptomyces bauhiniae TaxID=2340725 RepID=UPI00332C5A99